MVKKPLSHPYTGLLSRLVLAIVLGYAGLIKLFEPNGARDAIIAYRLGIPNDVAMFLGYAVPAIEIALAILLLAGLFIRPAAIVSGLLMAVFIVMIAQVWARGYSIDCGCFGGGGDLDPEGKNLRYTQEILRDLLFAGMAVQLALWPRTGFSLDRGKELPNYETEGK
jgi:uncharacterized membrane protein YphA (DoxX/SURF4 family)